MKPVKTSIQWIGPLKKYELKRRKKSWNKGMKKVELEENRREKTITWIKCLIHNHESEAYNVAIHAAIENKESITEKDKIE